MTDDIDRLISADATDDSASLDGVESAVWVRIGERRDRARMDQVRLAALALALVVGGANGGLMLLKPDPQPSEMEVFTLSAGLSPLASLGITG